MLRGTIKINGEETLITIQDSNCFRSSMEIMPVSLAKMETGSNSYGKNNISYDSVYDQEKLLDRDTKNAKEGKITTDESVEVFGEHISEKVDDGNFFVMNETIFLKLNFENFVKIGVLDDLKEKDD